MEYSHADGVRTGNRDSERRPPFPPPMLSVRLAALLVMQIPFAGRCEVAPPSHGELRPTGTLMTVVSLIVLRAGNTDPIRIVYPPDQAVLQSDTPISLFVSVVGIDGAHERAERKAPVHYFGQVAPAPSWHAGYCLAFLVENEHAQTRVQDLDACGLRVPPDTAAGHKCGGVRPP